MSVVECGLVINPEWPHLGASPDGIVQYTCCGKGVLEIKIKCPCCKHDQHIEVTAASCLTKAADGSLQLDRSHAYYYQVHTQIFICNVEYCDFCVCTFPETGPSLYTERIYPDSDFWHTCIDKATLSSGFVFYLKFLGSGTQGLPRFHSKPTVKPEACVSSAVHGHQHQMEG